MSALALGSHGLSVENVALRLLAVIQTSKIALLIFSAQKCDLSTSCSAEEVPRIAVMDEGPG